MVALDTRRPALMLTRPEVAGWREFITVAGITRTVRGLAVEVPVGSTSGPDDVSVVNCDDVHTIHRDRIGRFIGYLPEDQEGSLFEAIAAAFDLQV